VRRSRLICAAQPFASAPADLRGAATCAAQPFENGNSFRKFFVYLYEERKNKLN
jgi:hypothetical protein